jgi:hypothetical protein
VARESRHFLLSEDEPNEWARAVRNPGATVTFEQQAGSVTTISLPTPARGVSLEFRWIDDIGTSVPGIVALHQASEARNAPGLCSFKVSGGGEIRPQVRTFGAQIFAALRVQNAHFSADPDSLECLRELDAGPNVVLEGVLLQSLSIDLAEGEARMHASDLATTVNAMRNGSLGRYREDPCLEVRGYITNSRIEDVLVDVADGARIERCDGIIRVRRCLGTIVGRASHDGELILAADFDPANPPSDLLRGAVLMDVALEPATVGAFIAATENAKVFDPSPESIGPSLAALPIDERATAAELFHDRLGELAKRPPTVDAAATAVLDHRRSAAPRYSHDWFLFTVASIFGYGRRVVRPLIIWGAIVLGILAFRLGTAIDKPAGEVSWHDSIRVHHAIAATRLGGDILLTTILLPVNWSGRSDSQAIGEKVGVGGGYLVAVRVLMLVCLLTAGNAARRRIRVRPSNEAK